jgi:HAD superfamily hydrolase (TIGR01509 family)
MSLGAVIFDVDGTLIDTVDLHAKAWQEAFRKFGADISFDEIRSQIGKGGDNLIPDLLPQELVERSQEEIEDYRSELFQRDYLPRATPFPCVRELFERIVADGRRVVLASSAKEEELNFHRNLIGASDLIHAATSKDDVDKSKPCPDIFEAALAKVAPLGTDDVVVIGDSPWDIKAAAKIGIRAIGVRCGGFPEEELLEAGAAAIYDGPKDLLDRYESWTDA